MSFQRGAACPPAVEVERHSAGEETKWRAHITGCAGCGAYAKELQEASVAFTKQRPAEMFMRQVERRSAESPKRRPMMGWLLAGFGTLAVASVAVIIAPRVLTPPDEVRFKGGTVEVYFKRGLADPARVLEGSALKPGDTLRFRYRGEQRANLAVIEQDGAGSVTVFAPFGGTHSVEVQPEEFLSDAVAVDETKGTSRLFVIQKAKRFELQPLVDSITAFQEPSCEGCLVEALRYEKSE